MDDLKERLEDISEIRSLMERHSKFLSLSGLSGIAAGICGLLGAGAAFYTVEFLFLDPKSTMTPAELRARLIGLAVVVFIAAIGSALFFSIRMAKRKALPIWNKTAQRTLLDMFIPLLAGGLFCMIQLWHGHYLWIGSATLLFYGLALLNASRNTITEIRYLAYCEIALGLLCAAWPLNSLLFWAVGFGVLHIVYGTVMYYKYER